MTADPDVQLACADGDAPARDPAGCGVIAESSTNAVKSGNHARWLALTAMTAGLFLGVLLAASFGIGSDIRAGGGSLFAQGSLARALSDEMSGNRGIGPSFWSKDGLFCRAFDTQYGAHPGLDGIACRDGAGWRIRIVTTAAGNGEMPLTVRGVMENLIVGSPLDAAAERQVRQQGWQPR